jgi:hypothetical protein
MVFLLLVVFGFSTKPLTMIRLFAELSGHYPHKLPNAIVSRYSSFPSLAVALGLALAEDPVFTVPHPEDLRGCHVICDSIDLSLAAFACAVTVLPLNLPPEFGAAANTPLHLLAQYAGKRETFVVRGSSSEVIAQFNGGPTPSALNAALVLLNFFGIEGVEPIAFAGKIDEALFVERSAGAETEKFLLRMLLASHARACQKT